MPYAFTSSSLTCRAPSASLNAWAAGTVGEIGRNT